jgi:hypothetical protein
VEKAVEYVGKTSSEQVPSRKKDKFMLNKNLLVQYDTSHRYPYYFTAPGSIRSNAQSYRNSLLIITRQLRNEISAPVTTSWRVFVLWIDETAANILNSSR